MILMVNCSYKASGSNTQFFLELLKEKLDGESRIIPLKKVLSGGFAEFLGELEAADAFVIGAPDRKSVV